MAASRPRVSADASRLHWQAVILPGPFMPWSQEAANQTKVIWARRSFKVTPAQAQGLAVLRWNRIACGATAFLNGQKVGANEPTGPFQVIVPAGVLRPGDNQIVLKIRGAAGVPRGRSGNALIPAGFGVGMPEVTDDVWMDFADAAYMKWVLALPDLAGSRVKIRVTPTGPDRLDDLQIVAQVKSWPDGKVMGEGQAPARLTPGTDPLGGEHFFVEVPMPGFQPWTYEDASPLHGRGHPEAWREGAGRGHHSLRHARDHHRGRALSAERQDPPAARLGTLSSSGTGGTPSRAKSSTISSPRPAR